MMVFVFRALRQRVSPGNHADLNLASPQEMYMRKVSVFMALIGMICPLSLMSCGGGSSDDSTVARIEWRINYGDWTDPNAEAEIRSCTNQPAVNAGPAYDGIAKIHVLIEDPEGQIPGFDQDLDCSKGSGGEELAIQGIVRQNWDVTISALTGDDFLLYQYKEEAVDMTTLRTYQWDLKAMTSETSFFPRFAGSLECPEDVAEVRWSLFLNDLSTPAETANVTGSQGACDTFGVVDEVILRNVPVNPRPGANDGFVPSTYKIVLEGLDSGGQVTWCTSETARVFRPGKNLMGTNSDVDMSAGACAD